ncbi:mitochondrial ATP synthase epsilon chain-domain-containing protein [Mycena pura]|uniref:Mitochondrial ATP synthase epsilon chain-domain-containing protein n=1 Tax=Mycena pura TaxID=153505 RepID=A0AAD6YKU5_9AGAR|nr:mitochondrial ATP synthase epsilon chain-domain-containing protein [Mycena pura]
MSSVTWRSVFSYNKFIQITARALRNSLQETHRLAAEKRGLTALRYQKWEDGVGGTQTMLNPTLKKDPTKNAVV